MKLSDIMNELLTMLSNASHKGHTTVEIPDSKVKREILQILHNEGFIQSYRIIQDIPLNRLCIKLAYREQQSHTKIPAIKRVCRVSRPELRIVLNKFDVPCEQSGLWLLTTSRGVMSNKQARRMGIGGEVVMFVA